MSYLVENYIKWPFQMNCNFKFVRDKYHGHEIRNWRKRPLQDFLIKIMKTNNIEVCHCWVTFEAFYDALENSGFVMIFLKNFKNHLILVLVNFISKLLKKCTIGATRASVCSKQVTCTCPEIERVNCTCI